MTRSRLVAKTGELKVERSVTVTLVHCGSKSASSDFEMLGDKKKVELFFLLLFFITVKTVKQQHKEKCRIPIILMFSIFAYSLKYVVIIITVLIDDDFGHF